MKNNAYPFYYIIVGLLSLALCLLVGLLSGVQYAIPDFIKESLPFTVLRPLRTLFALSWIFMTAIGGIFWYIQNEKINPVIMKSQFWIFTVTGFLIAICYIFKKFEGKNIWNFRIGFIFQFWLAGCFLEFIISVWCGKLSRNGRFIIGCGERELCWWFFTLPKLIFGFCHILEKTISKI